MTRSAWRLRCPFRKATASSRCPHPCTQQAEKGGGSFTVGNSMEEAFKDADIVYPKSWAPFHVMQNGPRCCTRETVQGLWS